MKNKLFELSEEEKNSIRELHESYKKVHGTFSLNEQGGRVTGVRMTEPGKLDFNINRTKETGSLTSDYDKTAADYFDPNSNADKAEALKLYSEGGNWTKEINMYIKDKIKWWDLKSKNIFNKVIKETPQLIFNVTAQITNSDGDNIAITAERVVLEDPTVSTTTTPGTPGTEPDIQYVNFSADSVNESTSDFFADNKWEPTDKMKNYVTENIVNPIIQIYSEAMAKTGEKPVLFLNGLSIDSSVSMFLNSIDNEGNTIGPGPNPNRMSFKTLSENRANAAIQYLKSVLSPYVNWDDSVVSKNVSGANGDGSSGPNPYTEADKIITSPGSTLKSYKAVFDSEGFRQKYDKYKYTKFNISIGVVPIQKKIEEPGKEPIPGKVIEEKQLKVLFFTKDTDFDFTLKLPKFDWKYTNSAKAPGFWKIDTSKCKLKWWEKIISKYIVPQEF
jgi:hypothetical protein